MNTLLTKRSLRRDTAFSTRKPVTAIVHARNLSYAVFWVLASHSVSADGVLIAPVAVTAQHPTAPVPEPFTPHPIHMIDQTGLSPAYTNGSTDFDSYVASANHPGFSNMDQCVVGPGIPSRFTFDFGEEVTLDRIAVWNADSNGSPRNYSLYADQDSNYNGGSAATLVTSGTLANGAQPDSFAQVRSFSSTTTRWLHLVVTNTGGGSYVTIGEVAFRAEPESDDRDGDGLPNDVETNTGIWVSNSDTGTDPNNADTDADTLTDGDEILLHGTDPLHPDSDRDGSSDGEELAARTDPLDPTDSLRILEISKHAGGTTVTWKSVSGMKYTLKVSEDLMNFEEMAGAESIDAAADPATDTSFIDTVDRGPDAYYIVELLAEVAPAGMAQVPAGEFRMGRQSGSGDNDELPVHAVHVSAFYIDKFEVTKSLWDEVSAWAAINGYTDLPPGGGQGPEHPAQDMNWFSAVKWCNARSEMEGLTPAYYTNAAHTTVYKTGTIDLAESFVDWSANGYRLPTEAEWEKAARGGLEGNTYPWGNTLSTGDANYLNSGDPFESGPNPDTTPVGYYNGNQLPVGPDRTNGYGLYDMAGNVYEWVWDWQRDDWYSDPGATIADTRGPASSPLGRRVLRGGAWLFDATHLRCANRIRQNPAFDNDQGGFRCARSSL